MPRLILASASPRRQSLLREAGYEFEIAPADLDEASFNTPNVLPSELAINLAVAKASAVREKFPQDVILAADTIVAFGEQILGKPADARHATAMLNLLEGTTHLVITGVAVIRPGTTEPRSARVMSAVRMRALAMEWIQKYAAGGEWQGKAGGYGIQDNDPFVERISGCHTNIVGLPMTTTRRLLLEAGVSPRRK